jgi:PAS domain S-box-containing protein
MNQGTRTQRLFRGEAVGPGGAQAATSGDLRSNHAIDRLARLAARVLDAPFAGISVIDEGTQIICGSFGADSSNPLPASLTAQGHVRSVIESGKPLLVADVRGHPALAAEPGSLDGGVLSMISVPLGSADDPMSGVFCVGQTTPRDWSDGEVAILIELAHLATAEIARARAAAGRALATHAPATQAPARLGVVSAEHQSTTILESITDAFFALDREWRFTYVNEAAEKVLRSSRSDLLGRSLWVVFPQVKGTKFEDAYRRSLQDDVAVQLEEYFAPLDLWAAVHVYPSREGLSIYFRDISGRKMAEAKHAAAEAHYRRLVGSLSHAVYVVDEGGRFVEINPAAERILARPAEALLGAGFDTVISPRDLDEVKRIITDVVSGRVTEAEFESFILRPSGEERLLVITATAIEENGRITGLHGIARDVTVEREQQNSLRESEERFRQIAEHVKEAFWVYTPGVGSTLYVSPVYEQISGRILDGDDFHLGSFLDSVHPEDVEGVRDAIKQLSLGFTSTIEHRIIRPDGTIRRVLGRGFPILDSSGVVYRVVGTVEDITEEREREARQRLLVTALDGLGEGVCLLTADGEYRYHNRTYREILGIPDGEPANSRITNFAPDEETRRWQMEKLRDVMQHGNWRGRVQRRRFSDGELIVIDVTLGRVQQGGGSEDLIFGIIRDATAEISREQHLRRVERLASVVTLVGGVAHELNNPLNSVLNFAQLLAMDEPDPERREDLETIRREADRMARVVSDLRQVARSVREERQEKTLVDLNEVITHVLKVQESRLRTSNILVEVELDGSRPQLLADRTQLEQMLMNLIANAEYAMAATSAEGRLSIRSLATESGVDVFVQDDGPGIATELLDRIFDPFYTTKSPGEGMGLGLSLVHSIVAALGGQIHVTSQPGLGTTFRVELPGAPEARKEASALAEAVGTRSLRVLIVDDEPAIRRVLTRYLSRRGHAVDEASEGAAALRMIENAPYDVILTDLRMPGMGGEELLETLRERAIDVRLVFMTGDAGGGARSSELQVPLLHKPLDLAAVVRVVEDRSS